MKKEEEKEEKDEVSGGARSGGGGAIILMMGGWAWLDAGCGPRTQSHLTSDDLNPAAVFSHTIETRPPSDGSGLDFG